MGCRSCCAECQTYYECCKNLRCNRVRRQMCYHYKKEIKVFKNIIITVLAAIILLMVSSGAIKFDFPQHGNRTSSDVVERKLIEAIKLNEESKELLRRIEKAKELRENM